MLAHAIPFVYSRPCVVSVQGVAAIIVWQKKHTPQFSCEACLCVWCVESAPRWSEHGLLAGVGQEVVALKWGQGSAAL